MREGFFGEDWRSTRGDRDGATRLLQASNEGESRAGPAERCWGRGRAAAGLGARRWGPVPFPVPVPVPVSVPGRGPRARGSPWRQLGLLTGPRPAEAEGGGAGCDVGGGAERAGLCRAEPSRARAGRAVPSRAMEALYHQTNKFVRAALRRAPVVAPLLWGGGRAALWEQPRPPGCRRGGGGGSGRDPPPEGLRGAGPFLGRRAKPTRVLQAERVRSPAVPLATSGPSQGFRFLASGFKVWD